MDLFSTQPFIAIPIACIVGVMILSLIYCIFNALFQCIKTRMISKKQPPSTPISAAPQYSQVPYANIPNAYPQPIHNQSSWVDPYIYNGNENTENITNSPNTYNSRIPSQQNIRVQSYSLQRPPVAK